ncbi:MAG: DUF262 domain-containing protein [Salinivirgaceae bacterium]|nr:DUF262 domain-containing protein [Salinivirgaceae bacterium]
MQAFNTDFDVVLGTFQYVIPYFQRSYVWKQEQFEKFAEDMLYVTNGIANNGGLPFEYFMGTIISKQNQTPNADGYIQLDLVDGQQRITTFAIFFKVMSLVYNDATIFDKVFTFECGTVQQRKIICKLKSSKADEEIMDKILALQIDTALDLNGNPAPKDKWTKRGMPALLIAYNYFRDFLKKLQKEGLEINPFYIRRGVKFINMTLFPPYDDEQVYFDNINSLGVRLTTSAIIKNYVFQGSNKYEDYKKEWIPVFEKDERNKYWTGEGGKSNLDDFLFYYLQVKSFDKENGVTKSDKALYSRKDAVANHIKNLCEKYLNKDKNFLLKDIIAYADIYSKIVLDNIGIITTLGKKETVDDMLARLGYLIKKLKATTLIPYILFVVKKNSNNEKETLAILKYLESYLVRRSLTDLSSDNYNKYFREVLIAKNIITITELKDELLDTTNDRTTNMPTDKRILDYFCSLDYAGDNETPKALLYLYELELNKKYKSQVPLFAPDSYTLEHLMPQELKPNWTRPDQTEDHICKIGNMGLLTQSLQSVVKNRVWKEKLEGYDGKPGIKQSSKGLYIMENVINQTDWNNTIIDSRTNEIVQGIINIWKA